MDPTLNAYQILAKLSLADEMNERVWSAAVSALVARNEWPTKEAYEQSYDKIMAAMLKGLSPADKDVLDATEVPKRPGVTESADMTAKRAQRAVIKSRLNQRFTRLRDRLFPPAELLPEVRSVNYLLPLLPPAFSMLALAPSKTGKTTLVRQLVQSLMAHGKAKRVLVLSGTAHLSGDFSFLVSSKWGWVRAPVCFSLSSRFSSLTHTHPNPTLRSPRSASLDLTPT